MVFRFLSVVFVAVIVGFVRLLLNSPYWERFDSGTLIFPGVFLALVLGTLPAVWFWRYRRKTRLFREGRFIVGLIDAAAIDQHDSSFAYLFYSFELGDRLEDLIVGRLQISSSTLPEAEELVRWFPEGTVLYDPKNPDDNMLAESLAL